MAAIFRPSLPIRAWLRSRNLPLPLYFAYGANMDRAGMARRCPQSRPLGTGRLPRHRFIINADGYATIVRDPRPSVLGVMWDLALADVPALDRFEDVHRGLYSKIVQPVVMDGGARRALIYVGRDATPGVPKPGYLEAILDSATAWALPGAYIHELAGWQGAIRRPVR